MFEFDLGPFLGIKHDADRPCKGHGDFDSNSVPYTRSAVVKPAQITRGPLLKRADDNNNDNNNKQSQQSQATNNNNNNNKNDQSSQAQSQTNAAKSTANNNSQSKQQSQPQSSKQQQTTSVKSTEPATSASPAPSTSSPATSQTPTSAPTTSAPKTTDMPTLSSVRAATTTTSQLPDPSITVPSMSNNPYMGTSKVPEGTVFIAFGAILGGIIVALLVWRALAARALRRSLTRLEDDDSAGPLMGAALGAGHSSATLSNAMAEIKGHGPFSSDKLANNMSTDTIHTQSLYFSPTTEVMNSATNPFSATRSSTYLPAGFYSGTPGSMTSRSSRHFSAAHDSVYSGVGGAQYSRQSLVNRPYSSIDRVGSPDHGDQSPAPSVMSGDVPTRRSAIQHQSYNSPRAPSAYLDDLLAHDS